MSLKQEALSGIIWTFTQQFGTQIISFVVSLVLARLLLPGDFGMIAVFSVLMAVGNVLIDSGLTNSLIRTAETDDTDFSTVFYFNLLVSVLSYLLIVLTAPWVSLFFHMPELTDIIRAYAVVLPIGAFSAIQRTIFTKKLDFKTQLKVQIPSLIISGISGIVFALTGFGVWSLVYMAIIQSVVSTVQFWIYSKWRPQRAFDKNKFNIHFNFGYKLALSALLDIVFQNIYTVLIGRFFNTTQLGYYNKANSMQQLPVTSLTGPLNRVTYPLFSKIQDNNDRLKEVYKKLMKMVIFIVAPLLTVLGVLGEPLFRFLFTEKWLPAVPYFQILCITGILLPIHSYNLNVLKVKGRSDLFLKLEIIKKILIVISVVISLPFGIIGLLWGKVATSVIALFINCHYSGKFLKYNLWKQMSDLLPSIFLSIIMGGGTLLLDTALLTELSDLLRLLAGGGFAIFSYIILAKLFRYEELITVKEILFRKK